MLYGVAYYPEHRGESHWDADLAHMARAHLNAVRILEFAWPWLEPADGHYALDWVARFCDLAHRHALRVLLCPVMRTPPLWLVEHDPTMFILNADSIRLEYGSRYTFCINHPRLRQKGLALAEAMAQRFADHPAVCGWHLDNEYGDEPDCHCPICKTAWHAWLEKRYPSIDALNHAWGTAFWAHTYTRFDQIPTPKKTKTEHNPGLLQAWRQFRSDCTCTLIGLHAAAVRKHAPQPITTNFQALWNPRTDYADAAGHLDLVGTNYYPPYGPDFTDRALALDALRAYSPRPTQIHELRSGTHAIPGRGANTPQPGELTREVLHCIAHGADDLFYFRWDMSPFGAEYSHGALTDYAGRPTRFYHEATDIGLRLARLADQIEPTRVISQIALLWDFPSRWMLETNSIWGPSGGLYLETLRNAHRALRQAGYNVDAVPRTADLSSYRAVFIPLLGPADDALVARLKAYVQAGGHLLLGPYSAFRDADACVYPKRLHPGLIELLGLEPADAITSAAKPVANTSAMDNTGSSDPQPLLGTWRGKTLRGLHYADLVCLADATVEAQFAQSWFAGTPLLTTRRAGQGAAHFLATFPDAASADLLYPALARDAGAEPILPNVPPSVEVTERRAPDGRRLIFLLSALEQPVTIPLPAPFTDLWSGDLCQTQVTLAPHGVRVLSSNQ